MGVIFLGQCFCERLPSRHRRRSDDLTVSCLHTDSLKSGSAISQHSLSQLESVSLVLRDYGVVCLDFFVFIFLKRYNH